MGHLEKWGFCGCDKEFFGEELSWIIHLYPKWNYTSPCEAQGNWTPMEEKGWRLEAEVEGHMDVKECQHRPYCETRNSWAGRAPHCSCFYHSSRILSWISYFQTDDEFLLTSAPTFVLTTCSTMCNCGGKKSKIETERNLIRTAVTSSSDTRILLYLLLSLCVPERKGSLVQCHSYYQINFCQNSPLTGSWVVVWSPSLTINLKFCLACL